jgi:hypothetical protein
MEEREGQRRADPASRRTPASHAAGSILPPSPLDRRWFVHLADKTYGPYNGHEIKKLAAEGLITATALVYPEGGSAWIEAKNEPTLGALFRSQAPAPQPSSGIAAARTVAQTAPSTDNAATPANVKRKRKRFGFDPRTLFQSADQEAVRNDLRAISGRTQKNILRFMTRCRRGINLTWLRGIGRFLLRSIHGNFTAKCPAWGLRISSV